MKKKLYKLVNGAINSSNEYVIFKYDKIIYSKIDCNYVLGWNGNNEIKTPYKHDDNTLWNYDLIKLSKADKIHKIVNYIININELQGLCDCQYFIKLNFFESSKLKYYKKETILHKMNFYQRIGAGLFAIFVAMTPNIYGRLIKENKNSPNPNLNNTTQSTIKAIDSASIQLNQNIKLDSLFLSDSIK